MMNIVIAVAAGCAAGLMFASIVSGALISLLLLYLAPLPLLVAAIGWGPVSAVVGAAIAGVGLGVPFGFSYALAFLVSSGIPAVWLGYLALLAKPADETAAAGMNGASPVAADALEWYPPGRLLLWVGTLACLIVLSALLMLGTDYEAIMTEMRNGLTRVLSARGGPPPAADVDRLVEVFAQVAPAAATLMTMVTLTLNLWLAGRIVLKSQRLRRPWPDLSGIELPQAAIIALAAALVLSFFGGLLGMVSQIASAALLMAYLLVGFAVLHVITGSLNGRIGWLIAAYGLVIVLSWPAVLVIMLGLLDGVIGLRRRFINRTRPPPLST